MVVKFIFSGGISRIVTTVTFFFADRIRLTSQVVNSSFLMNSVFPLAVFVKLSFSSRI